MRIRLSGRGWRSEPIRRAIAACGSQARLAEIVGVNQQTVSAWLHGREVAAVCCGPIEVATGGKVTREQLRPEVAWKVEQACRTGEFKLDIVSQGLANSEENYRLAANEKDKREAQCQMEVWRKVLVIHGHNPPPVVSREG